MDSINGFFDWLFNTRPGVFALLGGGIVLFLLIAWLLEKRTRQQFYNHKKSPDDWDLFGEDEDE